MLRIRYSHALLSLICLIYSLVACQFSENSDTLSSPTATVTVATQSTTTVDVTDATENEAPAGPPLAPLRDNIQYSGVTRYESDTQPGYLLYSPLFETSSYLMNNDGEIVHSWPSDYFPASALYLMDNGDLLRAGTIAESAVFDTALREGGGGIIQLIDWDGNISWEFPLADELRIQHHDLEPLPNGNVLALVYEYLSADEAIAMGRNPELIPEENAIWSEAILEINPATNEIVWEWHVWDHLVQNNNASLPFYGQPAEHPELIDFNYFSGPMRVDWLHMNALDYNAELDQIVLSPREFSEIWIIDHSTTVAEAASSSGGRYGRGGDLLFRWGNPAAYGMGSNADQQLILQHDTRWIEAGLPGAGNLTIFDNGADERPNSNVWEIAPTQTEPGFYDNEATVVWQFPETPSDRFYSFIMGGAVRQPNGNTLIMESFFARAFEVTPAGEIVWEWYEPNRIWLFRLERFNLDHAAFSRLESE